MEGFPDVGSIFGRYQQCDPAVLLFKSFVVEKSVYCTYCNLNRYSLYKQMSQDDSSPYSIQFKLEWQNARSRRARRRGEGARRPQVRVGAVEGGRSAGKHSKVDII